MDLSKVMSVLWIMHKSSIKSGRLSYKGVVGHYRTAFYMKRIILIIISILVYIQAKSQTDFKDFWESMKDTIVEQHVIDIDNDKLSDTAIFRFPSNYDHPEFGYTDPGVFRILDLRLTSAKGILIEELFDTLPKKPFADYKNEINSDCAFLSNFNTKDRYLFMTGPSYGCCIEEMYVFSIKQNTINLISKSSLSLVEIKDFDSDGKIEVIGYDKLGEGWGGYKTNYVFHHLIFPTVFKLTDTLILDENLTYKYNSDLKDKYGDFLSFKRPVIVENMLDNSEILEEFENIKGNYYRRYDITSRTKIKVSALDKYPKAELRIMRNEIFAAHGYIFKSSDLREYFNKTKWYNPRFIDVTDKLTDIEKHNIELILKKEK
ncbi:MAG: hypothetical protein DRJ05_20345 [Bacteroidetes bacterium]|nr:MAG: hypothetical protein DRJ05_20345 [Bacteroidota bacterium]